MEACCYNHFILITETKSHKLEPDITVFEISGRLNLGNLLLSVENSIRGLVDGGARKLVIDVTGLNSIDSSGIGMLVSVNGHMMSQGGQMRIAGSHDAVAKVFGMVHMDKIIPIDADLATACANLSSAATA